MLLSCRGVEYEVVRYFGCVGWGEFGGGGGGRGGGGGVGVNPPTLSENEQCIVLSATFFLHSD